MQIQKPTDLDLHCLQSQGISGFSRTRVKTQNEFELVIVNELSVFESLKFYCIVKRKWNWGKCSDHVNLMVVSKDGTINRIIN